MKLKQSETSKFSTIPVSPIMSKWEKLGRAIKMVWTRTGIRQKVLLCSSLQLGQIFYALQVFGKFIKRACSEISWRWLIRVVCGVGSLKWLRWRRERAGLAGGKHSFSKCWGAVLLASWKPSIADWYWRRDSSDGCWRVSNTSSLSEGSNNGFREITLNARRWKRSSRLRRWAESLGHAMQAYSTTGLM